MAGRPLKKLTQNKKSSLDLADAVSRVKKAFDTNDSFNLETLFWALAKKYFSSNSVDCIENLMWNFNMMQYQRYSINF